MQYINLLTIILTYLFVLPTNSSYSQNHQFYHQSIYIFHLFNQFYPPSNKDYPISSVSSTCLSISSIYPSSISYQNQVFTNMSTLFFNLPIHFLHWLFWSIPHPYLPAYQFYLIFIRLSIRIYPPNLSNLPSCLSTSSTYLSYPFSQATHQI